VKLILVRHTTLDIEAGICYGQSDILPSVNFVEEADIVRDKLKKLNSARVYTSPLERCRKLAEFCGFENTIIDDRLMELNFGEWELKPWNEIKGEYAEKWFKDYYNIACPGGETLKDLVKRIKDFVNELYKVNSDNIIAFTHSGPIRVFHQILNGTKAEDLFDLNIEYGGVYTFQL